MPTRKRDCHAVLGLPSDASDDAIKAAYKKLALRWHPDRHLVGKERAAQIFIEVNHAYHALMDGKESTHSSSTEASTTTSTPTDTTHFDIHTKSTQASSRPPSASSHSSTKFSKSSSPAPCDDHDENSTKSGTHSRASPSAPSSPLPSSSGDPKVSSRPRPARARTDRDRYYPDQAKNDRRFFKSRDHPRDPPDETVPKSSSHASTHAGGPEDHSNPVHSKSSTKRSPHAEPGTQRGSRPEKTSCTGSGKSRASKPVIPPSSAHPHKSSMFGFADGFVHVLSKGATRGKKEPPTTLPDEQDAIPFGSPLRAIDTPRAVSKEWIFPLPLTLDEMYHGTTYRFLVTRELLSRQAEQVEISIDIPPGIRTGTRIVCACAGHQRKDGTLQNLVFLVEDAPGERFTRVKDDLFLDVCVPWADPLANEGGEISILGIDGKEITFLLPYPIYDKATEGQVLVKGAGMPIREGRKMIGRGDMIVRWRVVFAPHHSKWRTLKKALHLDGWRPWDAN